MRRCLLVQEAEAIRRRLKRAGIDWKGGRRGGNSGSSQFASAVSQVCLVPLPITYCSTVVLFLPFVYFYFIFLVCLCTSYLKVPLDVGTECIDNVWDTPPHCRLL